MAVNKCIRGKAAAGTVNKDKAEALARLFDDQEAELRHQNAPNPAELAALLTDKALKHQLREKKKRTLATIKAQSDLKRRVEGAEDPFAAAMATLDFDPLNKQSGQNVEALSKFIRGSTSALMADFLTRFGSKAAGLDVAVPGVRRARKAGLRQVVRELFGEGSGNRDAAAIAKGVGEAMEYQRRLFNASGGSIAKRQNWGLPQSHNRRLINSVSKDDWVGFVQARLDRSQMIDEATGLPFTDGKLTRVLSEVYEDIVTDGLRDVKPGFRIGRSLTGKRQHRRFLIFKDADTWFEYQERFGEADIFQTILGHMNGMSKDIAALRVLGPNPDVSIQFLKNLVGQERGKAAIEKTGKQGARATARIRDRLESLENVYAAVTGNLEHPANVGWANVFATTRNLLTSALLGGSLFSALADAPLIRMTGKLSGVPAARTMARMASLWNPLNRVDRKAALRAGFINELALGSAIGQARYFGEVVGPEWSRKLADVTLRLGGLSPWTQWGTTAFSLEFLGAVTGQAGRKFDNLEPVMKRAFNNYGITPDDWEIIRNTRLYRDEKSGAELLRPQDIIGQVSEEGPLFDRHFEAASKLWSMILTEADVAVPKTTQRVRALATLGARPGTFAGEFGRNAFLFKSFPITMIMVHLRRAVSGNISNYEKAKYFAHLIIGMGVMGMFGEQLSQISKGLDPLPLDPETEEGKAAWMRGLMRGGGLGVMGDFLFADVNRYGFSLGEWAAGPVAQVGTRFSKLTAGNIQEFIKEGEVSGFGRELIQFARLLTPGQSLWYARLAFERLIVDEIQKMLDPDYGRHFRDMENRLRREFDQEFFSPPGSGFPPPRAPDLSNVAA